MAVVSPWTTTRRSDANPLRGGLHGLRRPDLFPVIVECSQPDYDDGQHYDLAREEAGAAGYDEPMVVFDENDGPAFLFGHFPWSQAPVVVG